MTTTNKYENMTVTVSCNEQEDTELMNLIQQYKTTKTTREYTTQYYTPRIKAIGEAKWAVICEQLQSLCKLYQSLDSKACCGEYLQASFNRDDTGSCYRLRIDYRPRTREFYLVYGYTGFTPENVRLSSEYYYSSWGEDKDGWLVKWDEYDLYNRFRKNLMTKIQKDIKLEERKIEQIRENYTEIAGK